MGRSAGRLGKRARLASIAGLAAAVLLATGAILLATAKEAGGEDPGAATWVVIVRHAEKAADSGDPPLSPTGRERAEELRHALADLDVAALFASQFRRTQETLEPLADLRGIEIRIVPVDPAVGVAARAVALGEEIGSRHRGQTAVVSGHSNTVPLLIEALGVEAPPELDESDYDDLFVVRVAASGRAELTHLHYGRPSP